MTTPKPPAIPPWPTATFAPVFPIPLRPVVANPGNPPTDTGAPDPPVPFTFTEYYISGGSGQTIARSNVLPYWTAALQPALSAGFAYGLEIVGAATLTAGLGYTNSYNYNFNFTLPPASVQVFARGYNPFDAGVGGSRIDVYSHLPTFVTNYLTRWIPDGLLRVGSKQTWLNAEIAFLTNNYFNAAATIANQQYNSLVLQYNAAATTINNNPAYQNPGSLLTTITQTVAFYQKMLTDLVTATIASLTATGGPIVQGLLDVVNGAVASATQTINGLAGQVDTQVQALVGTVGQQVAILQAEADKQKAAAQARVTEEQAKAMAAVANLTGTAFAMIAEAQAQIGATAGMVIGEVARVIAQVQMQARDRPLFYGALSAPVSVSSTGDVIVIPPGGLVITAD